MKMKKTLHVTKGSNYLQTAIAMVSSLDDGMYDMIIMDKDYARSHDQNSLLWGVIYKGISDTTGYTLEQCHDMLRHYFNMVDEDGHLVSTATLTKTEFNEYLDKIINWASATIGVDFEEKRKRMDG